MKKLFVIALICMHFGAFSQNIGGGQIHGEFQTDFQYYLEDSLINAPLVKEKLLSNGYLNLVYTNQNLTMGVRYENYQNVMLGFDPRYKGSGIPYRFAEYKHKDFEITVGNYYEQFGSGLIFRSYEERSLGIDNSIDGMRLRYTPLKGVMVKGIIGRQRFFFDKGEGIVRGIDVDLNVNDFFKKLNDAKTRYSLGWGFTSKYQADRDPVYKLPENVGAWAARASVSREKWQLGAEYAYKINDPSTVNNFIYREGQALSLNASYTVEGFGINVGAKRIDNMNFRSDRAATGNVLMINYLSSLTQPHSYALASFYPYATQPNGEFSFQLQTNYQIKKNTKLGGKYGTQLTLNYARAMSIDKKAINDTTLVGAKGTYGYNSDFFSVGDDLYFEDFNMEISHKFSKKVKAIATYYQMAYNSDVIEGHDYGTYYASIGVLDMTYRFDNKKALRWELQHMYKKQYDKNWAFCLLEFSIAPKWFFSVMDNYNYGNDDKDKRLHYFMGAIGYVKNTSRITIGFGKQREGIVCIGGVCRNVPASYGLSVSVTSSF